MHLYIRYSQVINSLIGILSWTTPTWTPDVVIHDWQIVARTKYGPKVGKLPRAGTKYAVIIRLRRGVWSHLRMLIITLNAVLILTNDHCARLSRWSWNKHIWWSKVIRCMLQSDDWIWDQTSYRVWVCPVIESYQVMITTEIKLVRLD